MNKMNSLLKLLAAIVASSVASNASISIIGNFDAATSNPERVSELTGAEQILLPFTLSSSGYVISGLSVRLSNAAQNGRFEIYSDAFGEPDSVLGEFVLNSIAAYHAYLPIGTIELSANEDYWLVASVQENSPFADLPFNWVATEEPSLPIGAATTSGFQYRSSSASELVSLGAETPRFSLEGSIVIVPEPSTYALLLGMASLAVAARRRQ